MGDKKAKPKYELEDLLKVRERTKDFAEVVRKISNSECGDHLLKSGNPNNSSSIRSRRTRNSSIITNPWDKDDAALRVGSNRVKSARPSKYSPTPSIKRNKVERLLKEHGSPTGVRVTAGGRIVADGLSPLTSPRFEHGLQPKPGIFHPQPYGGPHPVSLVPYQGWVINIGDGKVGQIVDGDVRPVELRDHTLQLYMPDPNLPPQPPFMSFAPPMAGPFPPFLGAPPVMPGAFGHDPHVAAMQSQAPSAHHLRVMEEVHSKLELELKELNKNEVLQRGSLNARKRDEIVKRRIELTEQIDQSRRRIVDTKSFLEGGGPAPMPNNNTTFAPPPTSQLQPNTTFMQPTFDAGAHRGSFSNSDPNVFLARHSVNDRNGLQPELPDFVPRQFAPQPRAPPTEALRERSSNIGSGSAPNSSKDRDSTDTVKATMQSGMHLDGSGHQSRRSHAVEIKDPNDGTVKSRSSLNPASPSYKPKQSTTTSLDGADHGEGLDFMPSPAMIAQMETLVCSPRHDERRRADSTEMQQRSESSVNTADFFPHDTHQYSSKYDPTHHGQRRENIWMPKDGDPEPPQPQSTPIRPPNKFIYNNESPAEGYWNSLSDPVKPSENMVYQQQPTTSSVSPTRSHMRESTVLTEDNRYGRGLKCVIPETPTSEHGYQPAKAQVERPTTTQACGYGAGFESGFQQEIMADNADADFRRGYRDGLLQSMRVPDSAISMTSANKLPVETIPAQPLPAIENLPQPSATPTAGSPTGQTFPASRASPIPGAPHNSLATTPTHGRSTRKERSSGKENSLDSPSARADFEAQPNVSRSASKAINGQDENTAQSNALKQSPTKRREQLSSSELNYLAAKMVDLGSRFDQQRFAKSATSVFQNNDQASGYLSTQYDGSGQVDRMVQTTVPTSTPGEPSDTGKTTGSPVRRRASAAVATMKQVAGIGARKDESPSRVEAKRDQESLMLSNPPSPEKRAWRQKWTKGFRQGPKEEPTTDGSKRDSIVR